MFHCMVSLVPSTWLPQLSHNSQGQNMSAVHFIYLCNMDLCIMHGMEEHGEFLS